MATLSGLPSGSRFRDDNQSDRLSALEARCARLEKLFGPPHRHNDKDGCAGWMQALGISTRAPVLVHPPSGWSIAAELPPLVACPWCGAPLFL
jgi:hypothetical protein